jgi:hypothetical protein
MTRNTEVREFAAGNALTESELEKVSGGEDKLDPIAAWYRALGRVGLPLPDGGRNWMSDFFGC